MLQNFVVKEETSCTKSVSSFIISKYWMIFDAIWYSNRKVMQVVRNYVILFQSAYPEHIHLWRWLLPILSNRLVSCPTFRELAPLVCRRRRNGDVFASSIASMLSLRNITQQPKMASDWIYCLPLYIKTSFFNPHQVTNSLVIWEKNLGVQ
jgi:hypothetical protein